MPKYIITNLSQPYNNTLLNKTTSNANTKSNYNKQLRKFLNHHNSSNARNSNTIHKLSSNLPARLIALNDITSNNKPVLYNEDNNINYNNINNKNTIKNNINKLIDNTFTSDLQNTVNVPNINPLSHTMDLNIPLHSDSNYKSVSSSFSSMTQDGQTKSAGKTIINDSNKSYLQVEEIENGNTNQYIIPKNTIDYIKPRLNTNFKNKTSSTPRLRKTPSKPRLRKTISKTSNTPRPSKTSNIPRLRKTTSTPRLRKTISKTISKTLSKTSITPRLRKTTSTPRLRKTIRKPRPNKTISKIISKTISKPKITSRKPRKTKSFFNFI